MPHSPARPADGLCAATGKPFPPSRLIPLGAVRPRIAEKVRADWPGLAADALVSDEVVNAARLDYVRGLLEDQSGELSALDSQVVDSLHRHEVLSEHPAAEADDLTFGQRVADRIATFGGSWAFILTFLGILMVWIAANAWFLAQPPFDPYPFILLNLILSCLAALQAPVIMMSQNRQESRDRRRAENDYKINLKAELEIRTLHEKIDWLLHQQTSRLMEVQQIQMDQMRELAARSGK